MGSTVLTLTQGSMKGFQWVWKCFYTSFQSSLYLEFFLFLVVLTVLQFNPTQLYIVTAWGETKGLIRGLKGICIQYT